MLLLMVPVGLILGFGILVTRESEGVAGVHWNNKIAKHGIRFLTGMAALMIISGVMKEYRGVFVGLVISTKFMKKWMSF